MAETGLDQEPHSWTVIPPQYTLSRHVEVLIGTGSTILVVDSKETVDQVIWKKKLYHYYFKYSIINTVYIHDDDNDGRRKSIDFVLFLLFISDFNKVLLQKWQYPLMESFWLYLLVTVNYGSYPLISKRTCQSMLQNLKFHHNSLSGKYIFV